MTPNDLILVPNVCQWPRRLFVISVVLFLKLRISTRLVYRLRVVNNDSKYNIMTNSVLVVSRWAILTQPFKYTITHDHNCCTLSFYESFLKNRFKIKIGNNSRKFILRGFLQKQFFWNFAKLWTKKIWHVLYVLVSRILEPFSVKKSKFRFFCDTS